MAFPQQMVFDYEPDTDHALSVFAPRLHDDEEYDMPMEQHVSGLPRDVEDFIVRLHKGLVENNDVVIGDMYDRFTRLCNGFYKHQPWPSAEEITHLVEHDEAFLLFYRELYYRHLHFNLMSSGQVTVEDRMKSWTNFEDLFDYFMEEDSSHLKIPESWLCAMVEEYIYQFHQFSLFRVKEGQHRELAQNPEAWHVMLVLSRLQTLVVQSEIEGLLENDRQAYEADESTVLDFETLTTPQRLGYFALFGLLRLHCMLGDYYAALKSIEKVDFHRRSPLFYRIDSLHLTVQYYQSFCMMMAKKYAGAVRVLSRTLGFLLRARTQRSDETNRRMDKMFHLLALCVVLSGTKPEETVDKQLRERLGDKIAKMTDKSVDVYLEMFQYSCPKFINPCAMMCSTASEDMGRRQAALFRRLVESQLVLPELRSFLNLYTSVSTAKLAQAMDMSESDVKAGIIALKQSSLADEDCAADVPVCLNGNDVKVVDPNLTLPTGDYFMRYIIKLNETTQQLHNMHL
jgi:translation initiation factor 3 subunit L